MQLTLRDEELISWVAELRFATQEQLQRLLFSVAGASASKRRLTLLYHNAYLDRRLIPLRSNFGANRAAYCLDRRGAELLRYRTKTGLAQIAWRPRDNDRELYFLEHLLACNDVRVSTTLAAREQGFDLDWIGERTLRTRAMRDAVSDPTHPQVKLAVIPDGYFQLAADGSPLGFAVELDRATVEEKPFKTKIRALTTWKTSGAYARRFDTDSLRVLFVVDSIRRDANRLARIKKWTEAEGGQNLFWFTHLTELTDKTVFGGAIWRVAGRSGNFPLFD
jgi:hypothetical protein